MINDGGKSPRGTVGRPWAYYTEMIMSNDTDNHGIDFKALRQPQSSEIVKCGYCGDWVRASNCEWHGCWICSCCMDWAWLESCLREDV